LGLLEETVSGTDGVDIEQPEAWFWEYGDSVMLVLLEYHIEALNRWKDVRIRSTERYRTTSREPNSRWPC
jgi:hypothetical protein